MKALAISMVAGAALCSLISVPALAMPMSNLAAAASDLALGQGVRYVRHHYRYRLGRSSYYAYGAVPPPWSRRFGITATESFARKQPGFTPGSGQEAEDVTVLWPGSICSHSRDISGKSGTAQVWCPTLPASFPLSIRRAKPQGVLDEPTAGRSHQSPRRSEFSSGLPFSSRAAPLCTNA
jgi:hypothetical protein